MKRILIINIDPPHRSAYSATVGALLKKKYPSAQISIVVSAANELFHTVEVFEKVLLLDVDVFFSTTIGLSNEEIEEKMRNYLGPFIDVKWDLVVNLSSNLLGTIYTCFLNYKTISGPYSKADDPTIEYSNLSSLLLMNVPDQHENYFHFLYLYKDIAGIYYELPVKSHFEEKLDREFNLKMESLFKKSGKRQIVLIDADMKENENVTDFGFLAELYKKFDNDPHLMPLFFSMDPEGESQILSYFKDLNSGEVNFVKCQNKGQLYLIGHCAIVVTDNLYLKALADIASTPSIIIGRGSELPLSDFSAIHKSCLIFFKQSGQELPDVILKLSIRILKGGELGPMNSEEFEIYETVVYEALPVLQILKENSNMSSTYKEYVKWWLHLKFMAEKKQLIIPKIKFDSKLYKHIIGLQKQHVQDTLPKDEASATNVEILDGFWQIEASVLKFNRVLNGNSHKDLKQNLSTMKAKMLNFLSAEESSST